MPGEEWKIHDHLAQKFLISGGRGGGLLRLSNSGLLGLPPEKVGNLKKKERTFIWFTLLKLNSSPLNYCQRVLFWPWRILHSSHVKNLSGVFVCNPADIPTNRPTKRQADMAENINSLVTKPNNNWGMSCSGDNRTSRFSPESPGFLSRTPTSAQRRLLVSTPQLWNQSRRWWHNFHVDVSELLLAAFWNHRHKQSRRLLFRFPPLRGWKVYLWRSSHPTERQ